MPVNPDDRARAAPAREVYSVTRVNREVRALLERGLGVLWVEGELSNLSQPASGHWYFSLKDRDAQLRCAMFRAQNSLVGFTPRAGTQVLVRGRISVYEARGAAAAPALVAALQTASARAECQVLILARGGGSLEDLWAFNDERVARAIRACRLPVVSGVGHEIDFTIADLAADARAPTPSGAAELVVPERRACLEVLARSAQRLTAGMHRELRVNGARLENTARRLKLAHPGVRLQQQMQRLDELAQRLGGAAHAGPPPDLIRPPDALP